MESCENDYIEFLISQNKGPVTCSIYALLNTRIPYMYIYMSRHWDTSIGKAENEMNYQNTESC